MTDLFVELTTSGYLTSPHIQPSSCEMNEHSQFQEYLFFNQYFRFSNRKHISISHLHSELHSESELEKKNKTKKNRADAKLCAANSNLVNKQISPSVC